MIVYALTCGAGHHFDAWFRSSGAFDRQRQDGALSCPVCGDGDVRKAPMAPYIARGGDAPAVPADAAPDAQAAGPQAASTPAAGPGGPSAEALARLTTLMRHHLEANCEDVGARFPEEARRMHYGESESRGIYGEASPSEASELRDEGITALPLPWFVRRND